MIDEMQQNILEQISHIIIRLEQQRDRAEENNKMEMASAFQYAIDMLKETYEAANGW